jgi:hypothetical protein
MKLNEDPKLPFVEVWWDDASATNEWDEGDLKDDGLLVLTKGFLIKETKTAYYVTHTVSRDTDGSLQWNSRIRIPKGMIKSYKVL